MMWSYGRLSYGEWGRMLCERSESVSLWPSVQPSEIYVLLTHFFAALIIIVSYRSGMLRKEYGKGSDHDIQEINHLWASASLTGREYWRQWDYGENDKGTAVPALRKAILRENHDPKLRDSCNKNNNLEWTKEMVIILRLMLFIYYLWEWWSSKRKR